MGVVIIILGAICALIGFFIKKRHNDLKTACTMQTAGSVIAMQREESVRTERNDDGHARKTISVNYYPVYEYVVDGRKIEKKSSTGTSKPRFTEGQSVSVFYNPSNAEQYYVAEDKAAASFGIYFMIFGIVVTVLGVVALFVPMTEI